MRKDYYKILGIKKGASDYEIKRAYRRLALWYHPDKKRSFSSDKFLEITEAYNILLDPIKREEYDNTEVNSPPNNFPYQGTTGYQYTYYQDTAVEHDLCVSLEDILNGCSKLMKISRNVIYPNGFKIREDKILTIDVIPGCQTGTRITFPYEGDQDYFNIPADVVFIIRDKPHALFRRENSDIKYILKLSLEEAIFGTFFDIPTLTDEIINLNLTKEIVRPDTVKTIRRRGLPFPNNLWQTGDLLISFDISLTDTLTLSEENYYTTLGINKDASDDEIKEAFRRFDPKYQPAIEHELQVSLENLLNGTKRMKISKKVIQPDGSTMIEDKVLTIYLDSGLTEGTRITFHREGDQIHGKVPADIIFIFKDKPHVLFKREGSNIRYTKQLSLEQAVCGLILKIPTLTGENVTLNMTKEVIRPNTVKRIRKHGLPLPEDSWWNGDLLVAFDIKLPKTLTQNSDDYYEVLGVNPAASDFEIRTAYSNLTFKNRLNANRHYSAEERGWNWFFPANWFNFNDSSQFGRKGTKRYRESSTERMFENSTKRM